MKKFLIFISPLLLSFSINSCKKKTANSIVQLENATSNADAIPPKRKLTKEEILALPEKIEIKYQENGESKTITIDKKDAYEFDVPEGVQKTEFGDLAAQPLRYTDKLVNNEANSEGVFEKREDNQEIYGVYFDKIPEGTVKLMLLWDVGGCPIDEFKIEATTKNFATPFQWDFGKKGIKAYAIDAQNKVLSMKKFNSSTNPKLMSIIDINYLANNRFETDTKNFVAFQASIKDETSQWKDDQSSAIIIKNYPANWQKIEVFFCLDEKCEETVTEDLGAGYEVFQKSDMVEMDNGLLRTSSEFSWSGSSQKDKWLVVISDSDGNMFKSVLLDKAP